MPNKDHRYRIESHRNLLISCPTCVLGMTKIWLGGVIKPQLLNTRFKKYRLLSHFSSFSVCTIYCYSRIALYLFYLESSYNVAVQQHFKSNHCFRHMYSVVYHRTLGLICIMCIIVSVRMIGPISFLK